MTGDDTITITLTGMAQGGAALGRHAGKVLFVQQALPGETVRVQITDDRGKYAFARLVGSLRPRPSACAAVPYFGACGGCQWQHASYAAQLRYKREIVVDQLTRIGASARRAYSTRWPAAAVELSQPHAHDARARRRARLPRAGAHTVVPIRECAVMDAALADLYASLDIDDEHVLALHLRAGTRTCAALVVFGTDDDEAPGSGRFSRFDALLLADVAEVDEEQGGGRRSRSSGTAR
jgi:23S rRNA (uracil1939-C5)-methyltransferase